MTPAPNTSYCECACQECFENRHCGNNKCGQPDSHQSSHSLQQFPNRLNPSVVTEALDEMYGQSSQSKGETDWKAALSTAGVFVEDLSSNGDTLLIKVKDSDFEYGIYDQKKLEAVVSKLLSDTDEKMWRLLPQKITTAYDAGFAAGTEAERKAIIEFYRTLPRKVIDDYSWINAHTLVSWLQERGQTTE